MKIQKPSFDFEKKFWAGGIKHVIGIDEVGRGAFAGPIVAAAVAYPPNFDIRILKGVNDSKLLSYRQREKYCEVIKKHSIYSIESIEIKYINKHGIGKANTAVFRKALRSVLTKIQSKNYFILIDGFHKKDLPGGIKKQKGITKGDRISLSIASASILAKVYRDNLMISQSGIFPNYKFIQNKGYGTKDHREAIKIYGLTEIHRTSFNLQKFL